MAESMEKPDFSVVEVLWPLFAQRTIDWGQPQSEALQLLRDHSSKELMRKSALAQLDYALVSIRQFGSQPTFQECVDIVAVAKGPYREYLISVLVRQWLPIIFQSVDVALAIRLLQSVQDFRRQGDTQTLEGPDFPRGIDLSATEECEWFLRAWLRLQK